MIMRVVTGHAFEVDAFLFQPLTARVATNGPTVRPTWFLWEDHAFWILSGPWARLMNRVRADPALAVVVDQCDLTTGLVRQVIARGQAEVRPFDVPRGRRKLTRYLGTDETRWDQGFAVIYTTIPPRKGPSGCDWIRPPSSSRISVMPSDRAATFSCRVEVRRATIWEWLWNCWILTASRNCAPPG
jgi:hypothetical protein